MTASVSPRANDEITKVKGHSANNYAPLDLVLDSAEGAWITDVDGKRYLDCLSAYSATTFGHAYPKFIEVLREQTSKISIASRAVYVEGFGDFAEALANLAGKDMILAMNTGAEANETAIKIARKWGYRVKGVPADQAKIIGAEGNFHGRTTTMISLSDDELARADYGPFTPGFELVPYNDAEAIRNAIDENTVAVILEPIQGEAGIAVPDEGYLAQVREITREHNVLLILDEVQTGFMRTGDMFAANHEGVVPDLVTTAKGIAGGLPLSAVTGRADIMDSSHAGGLGGTYTGNPIACAAALATIETYEADDLGERAHQIGAIIRGFFAELQTIDDRIGDVRGRGGMSAIELVESGSQTPNAALTGAIARFAAEQGVLVLTCGTYGNVIRFLPPLSITDELLREGLEVVADALRAN